MLPLMCESVFLAGTSASLCRDSNPSFAPGDCLRRERLEIRGAGRSPVVGAARADMIAVIGIYLQRQGVGTSKSKTTRPKPCVGRRQAGSKRVNEGLPSHDVNRDP